MTPEDLDAAFREHATLGQWIAEHAPADVTRQLADAYLRPLDTSSAEQSQPGADDDVKTLLAAQRRREAWVGRHATEIETWSRLDQDLRRHEYRLGQAAAYSQPDHTTAVLGPLPERITGVEQWQSAAGAIEAYRSRWGVDTRTRSALSLSTPNSAPTGRGQSGPSSRRASRRPEAPMASSTSCGSRHSGIGWTPSMPHGRRQRHAPAT